LEDSALSVAKFHQDNTEDGCLGGLLAFIESRVLPGFSAGKDIHEILEADFGLYSEEDTRLFSDL